MLAYGFSVSLRDDIPNVVISNTNLKLWEQKLHPPAV